MFCRRPVYCTVLERPLQELREELQTDVTEALASYRKHSCSASVSAGQVSFKKHKLHLTNHDLKVFFSHLNLCLPLFCHAELAVLLFLRSVPQLVLPQHLRALPVYINSLRKSDVLLPGLRTSVPRRLQQRCQVLGMDALCVSTHFYPLLLPLVRPAKDVRVTAQIEKKKKNVRLQIGYVVSVCPFLQTPSVNPPRPEEALRCSAGSLKPAGLYLVHAPLALLLWVGAQVPACTLVQLFNTNCFFSLSSGEVRRLNVLSCAETANFVRSYVPPDQAARSPDPPVLQRSIPHSQAERPGALHSQGERLTKVRLRFIQHF